MKHTENHNVNQANSAMDELPDAVLAQAIIILRLIDVRVAPLGRLFRPTIVRMAAIDALKARGLIATQPTQHGVVVYRRHGGAR